MDSYAWLPLLVVSASLLLAHSGHVAGSGMRDIRGVPVFKKSLYVPDHDFQCLDGSLLISFTKVNDDYCDCADGSDEPGTSACTNGVFYCENVGHKAKYIPSTWVNDGVCDCCDTSDEYASNTICTNNCNELGREARLVQLKEERLAREGNKLRLEMVAKGKGTKTEYQSRLVKMRADYEEALLVKKEKESTKNAAEELERYELDKYKPVEPPAAEEEATEAEDYFKLLDSDESQTITLDEVQSRATFDKDRDGVVSEEEAMYFLGNNKVVTKEQFLETAWPNMKHFIMLEKGIFKSDMHKSPEQELSDDAATLDEEPEEGLEEGLEEGEVTEGEEEEEIAADEHEKEEAAESIQYDENTKMVIEEANHARERFQEAEKAVNELQSTIRQLEEKLDRDYGLEEEFALLDGECFEYTDMEYIYKLCLYDKAIQKSKSGGSEVILGHWNKWIGPPDHKYSKMKYDKGLTCWNGPMRSTTITLTCGMENELTSVTEPSRCEYAMEFSTPALCHSSIETDKKHDEL